MPYLKNIHEVTAPSIEPVTLSEAKDFLRLTHDEDNDAVTAMVKAARMYCENLSSVAMIARRISAHFNLHKEDALSKLLVINLPHVPLIEVHEVKLVNADGSETVVSLDDVVIQSDVDRIVIPNASLDKGEYISIEYDVGYGAAASDVPESLKHAVLLKTADLYEARGDADKISQAEQMVRALIAPYKKHGVGV